MLKSLRHREYFFIHFTISLVVTLLFTLKAFRSTTKFNDYFTHDNGTYLSISVHPWEAISSLKGLAFPGYDYGSVLGSYLLYPITFLKIDLFTIYILINFLLRFFSYLAIAIFFFSKRRLLFGYLSLLYPFLINSATNFTWGYYFYSETEFISVLLMIYLIQNRKYSLLAFLSFGIISRLDLRQIPLFLIALIFFSSVDILKFKNFFVSAFKNVSIFLAGFLATSAYLILINPLSHSNFNYDFKNFPLGLNHLKEFLGVALLSNIILLYIVILYFVILLGCLYVFSDILNGFKIITINLLLLLIFVLFLSSTRMLEVYTTFNPNRIFLLWPLSILLLLSFLPHRTTSIFQTKSVSIGSGLLVLFLSFIFSIKPIIPPSLGTQGPAPILERLSLKKDCENLVKFGPNIGTEYIETIDWRLGFTCDALLIPDKRYKFINANSMGLGEVRPWRREVINR